MLWEISLRPSQRSRTPRRLGAPVLVALMLPNEAIGGGSMMTNRVLLQTIRLALDLAPSKILAVLRLVRWDFHDLNDAGRTGLAY